MRIAGLLSGDPRFCKEFDIQLENLKNSNIDWYIAMWKRDYRNDENSRYKWVGNFWKSDFNLIDATDYIQKRLPKNHTVASLKFFDDEEFKPKTSHYIKLHTDPLPMLYQWYMVKKAWGLLESAANNNYDIIIRSRMDLEVSPQIDFLDLYNTLKNNPQNIITRLNAHHRYSFDGFAIGLYDSIKKYCQTIDYIEHFNVNLGHEFDPELLANTIWKSLGLTITSANISTFLRKHGTGRNWLPEYTPDFGTWA